MSINTQSAEQPSSSAVDVIVIGAGMGGLAAAVAAADRGLEVCLLEAGPKIGGAASYSGGQVWVGGNHVARASGVEDSIDAALTYVRSAASRDATSVDAERSREWLEGAAAAAEYFERTGVIRWDVVPDYPDYYYPDAEGSRPTGRYLTSTPYDGTLLGDHLDRLHVSPHFPVGITYGEMFSWGGMSSKTDWDWDLVGRRRAASVLTFGTGITAPFFAAALERGVRIRTGHRVTAVSRLGDELSLSVATEDGPVMMTTRDIVLATGAHDWSDELMQEFTGIPRSDGGSVAPPSIRGDGVGLAESLGGIRSALPPWAAPVLPGYVLPDPAFEGDSGHRACYEHCLPHTIIVDGSGERFCDDSFHSRIVSHVLGDGTADPGFPIFMIWDEQHHAKYGLGSTMPGGDYPEGLVTQADSPEKLAAHLGIEPAGLASSIHAYNADAVDGLDPAFGRGSNLSVRRFRGDGNQSPNPCVGPLDHAPYFGMRLRLLSTGIAAAGVSAGRHGRLLDGHGAEVPGVHVAGELAARAAAGVGYNSGYSLSRALAYGYLAAQDIADQRR